ncbi:MAG: helix-turn-helix domain-containing protein [Bacteroidales bacterium]|nr:helix-turn-helix domain-containing protein [Bacteroidales bacterium]
MPKVLNEITKLSDQDCFYIVERYKSEFDYPLHGHEDYELNFIERGKGLRRVVGDSVEEVGEYELTLVTGKDLAHVWEQGTCSNPAVREITIQFSPKLFSEELLSRRQFESIKQMLKRAELGLNFSLQTIMKVYSRLDSLPSVPDAFDQVLSTFKILYELSLATDSRVLASSPMAQIAPGPQSRRVNKVREYISENYASELSLEKMAEMVGMAPTAFSRFFKIHTNRTLMEYILDVRLGNAARMLIDTSKSISEICYACGFNNLSNFNRIFKKRRGYTPRDFRALFKENRVYV